jgi:hypothetical protein
VPTLRSDRSYLPRRDSEYSHCAALQYKGKVHLVNGSPQDTKTASDPGGHLAVQPHGPAVVILLSYSDTEDGEIRVPKAKSSAAMSPLRG